MKPTLRQRLHLGVTAAVIGVFASTSLAMQETQPASGPAVASPAAANAANPGAAALTVRVKELKGVVTVSTDDGKTWKRVSVGDEFNQGAILRTSLRSAVTCTVGTSQMFTLESVSTMRIEEAIRTGGKEKTDLVMKYGAASYGIERAGLSYDAVIRTPGSTMSIGGTVVRIVDRAGFAPQAESYTGRALFRTAKGATFIGGTGYSVASGVQGSAAETALANSSIDPSLSKARTAAESAVISQQLSQGGVLGFDQRAQIPIIRNGSALPDSALPSALPGRLSFALRWTGNADLNFIVDNMLGNQNLAKPFKPEEILFPGYGLNVSTSGGLIPFDNRGGRNGGTEIAYWKGSFPAGIYGVGVLHASGSETDFKINAFLDGQPLPIFAFDAEGTVVKVNTFSGTIGAGGGDGAILFAPRNLVTEANTPSGDDAITQQIIARSLKPQKAKLASASPSVASSSTSTANPTAAIARSIRPNDASKSGRTNLRGK